MVWFFIAGWISGAVFMVLYARWWVHKHIKKVSADEAIRDIEAMKNEEDETHE